ncbi:RNA polymerase sigma factor [Singulisphaera sp. PoT]|uniref:RNA polymerase sigma factor n=1 Tax=Singulisphaera sp. PoT TaxID=3411797 RepID=UPI003BF50469
MVRGGNGEVLRDMDRLFGEGSLGGVSPGRLLERFATGRDPGAFAALVERFGPMVLGLCRRMLDDPHDVEDAFQATFLLLVRKASSIRDGEQLGPWLHGVARRVALRARAQSHRRRLREHSDIEALALMESPAGDPDQIALRWVLDEEIGRLPEKYRFPIVLCYLEGLTHEEAAHRLRCPVGTVHTRMAWARARLRHRLDRRGLALATSPLGLALAPEVVPAALVESTRALVSTGTLTQAAGKVSAGAIALAEGVRLTMFSNTLKGLAAIVVTASLAVGGAGALAQHEGQVPETKQGKAAEKPASNPDVPLGLIRERTRSLEVRQAELERELSRVKAILKQLNQDAAAPAQAPPPSEVAENKAPTPGESDAKAVQSKPADRITAIPKEYFTLISPSDKNQFLIWINSSQAPANLHKKWFRYTAPQGLKATPSSSTVLVAPSLEGAEIREVAVFCLPKAEWISQALDPPAKSSATPRISGFNAEYIIDNKIYSYHGLNEKKPWSVLELEKGCTPRAITTLWGDGYEDSKNQYYYNKESGEWQALSWDLIESKAKASEREREASSNPKAPESSIKR